MIRNGLSPPFSAFGRARVVRHRIADPRWLLPDLTIAVLSDFHVCAPWVSLATLRRLVGQVNRLGAGLILLPGDFIAERKLPGRVASAAEVIGVLSDLRAPLGVAAVLGNHDWRDCRLSRQSDFARNSVRDALDASPIRHLANAAACLRHGDGVFWLAGLDSQQSRKHLGKHGFEDPEAAFAEVPAGAPVILMAHEPDYFGRGDPRAFLQVSGHTHGGQVNLLGWRPIVPSRYGARYAWGHVQEGGRHLVVSGGIGYSGIPLRVLQPPEITLVTLQCGR
ncbi:metallophosphoesterase [Albidovulum sp.]|uniref:metallophosphoesterase n=1 Tax=Albidovulum sp. TaxID=1872424 RepID=UPI0035295BC1